MATSRPYRTYWDDRAVAWCTFTAGGTKQVENIVCTNGAVRAGNITMRLTAAVLAAPGFVDTVIAMSGGEGVNDVAGAFRTAMDADTDITDHFYVEGATFTVRVRARVAADDDATMAFSFTDTGGTGVTFGASTDEEAGVAPYTTPESIEHDGDWLSVGATYDTAPGAPRLETHRFAIKTEQPGAPDWVSLGPVAGIGSAMLILLDNATNAGNVSLEVGVIGSDWDETATADDMNELFDAIGTWRGSSLIRRGYGHIPTALFVEGLPSAAPYGYAFRVRYSVGEPMTQNFRFSTTPLPVIRRYYQYTATPEADADATERPVLDDAVLAILEDRADYRRFMLAVEALVSERIPAEDNVTLTVTSSVPALISRRLNWPEPWTPDIPTAGGLPLSGIRDSSQLDALQGMAVRSTLSVIDRTGTEHEVSRQIQVAGDALRRSGGVAELELRSPIEAILQSQVVDFHPAGATETEYDAEQVIAILVDALLNSGRWTFSRLHYNDLAQLYQRFALVWGDLTFSAADLEDTTVADLFAEIAPYYGLCVSQAADGCIDIWHPGTYRPSMRVHYVSADDCQLDGLTITDRGRSGQYGVVTATVTTGPTTYWWAYPDSEIATHDSWTENVFDVEFNDRGYTWPFPSLQAVARQVGQYVTGRQIEAELLMGLRGLAVDLGDVLVIAHDDLDGGALPFLVTETETDPIGGTTRLRAICTPDALGLCSLFEDDGVRGIWRWVTLDEDRIAEQDLSNMAHGTAPDPAFVQVTAALSDPLPIHWQGPMLPSTAVYRSDGSLLSVDSGDPSVCDIFDLAVLPYEPSANPNLPGPWPQLSTDVHYVPFLYWREAVDPVSDSALVIGLVVDKDSKTNVMQTNRPFIGYTLDTSDDPIVWEWIEYGPYGAMGVNWTGTTDTSRRTHSIAVQWMETTIRLYLDRRLLLEVTDADTLAKSNYDDGAVYLTAQNGFPFGCFRHLRQYGWLTNLQRLQGYNGIDPFYGPDALTGGST